MEGTSNMAARTKKKNEKPDNKNEIFEALQLLEKERGIPVDFMLEKIKKAILTACKNSYDNEDAVIDLNPETGMFEVRLKMIAVDDVWEPGKEVLIEKARKIDPTVEVGDDVYVTMNTKQFGRIAAQTARNIIRQGIRASTRAPAPPRCASARPRPCCRAPSRWAARCSRRASTSVCTSWTCARRSAGRAP